LLVLTGGLAACSADGQSDGALGLPQAPAAFDKMATALQRVCADGYSGNREARVFDPNLAGPHRLLFIAADGTAHALNNVIPDAWRPSSTAEVELVACTGELQEETVERCEYVGTSQFTVARKLRSLGVRIVSVSSGGGAFALAYGFAPGACPPTLDHQIADIVGAPPRADDVRERVVDTYVPVPTCGGQRPFASCLQCFRNAAEATSDGCGRDPRTDDESLPKARTGTPVTVSWREAPLGAPQLTSPLYAPFVGFDWSTSDHPELFDSLVGKTATFTPSAAGSYRLTARAVLPAVASGQVIESHSFRLEVVDPPVVSFDLGVYLRAGHTTQLRLNVSGREPTLHPGEDARFSWVERPADSEAVEPTLTDPQFLSWSFAPDLPGDYRVQVDYNDGAGFSDPLVSPPITAFAGPIVYASADNASVMVGSSVIIHADTQFAVGEPTFQWKLLESPSESAFALDLGQDAFRRIEPDVPGTYLVQVVATDDLGSSDPIEVTIHAE
jgi:hypothetical protein